MLKTKTVFLVGAGASKELGLPLGGELQAIIAKKLDIKFKHDELISGDHDIANAIRAQYPTDFNRVRQLGCQMSEAIPLTPSIDNYLNAHQSDSTIVWLGKIAIAKTILEAERKSSLSFNPRERNGIDFSMTNSWHGRLCRLLMEMITKENIEKIFDNCSIVTFNYDRCIEYYIPFWLATVFNINMERAQTLARKLQIVHVYGTVGKLSWQADVENNQFVDYGYIDRSEKIVEAGQQIKTFTEGADADLGPRIRGLLSEATRWIFLGFSLGDINLNLLNQTNLTAQTDIIGTVKGISHYNLAVKYGNIRKYISNPVNISRIELVDQTCSEFFDAFYDVIAS